MNNLSIQKKNTKFIIMENNTPYKFHEDGLIQNEFENIQEAENMLKIIYQQKEIREDVIRIFGEE